MPIIHIDYQFELDNQTTLVSTLIGNACVLNWSHGHWVFSDALHVTITMNLKLRFVFENEHFVKNLMEEYFIVVFKLALLAFNNFKKLCVILKSSFSLW